MASDEDLEAARAEKEAMQAGPPKGATLSAPPEGVATHGWFIDHDGARAYRQRQYAKQKTEGQATMKDALLVCPKCGGTGFETVGTGYGNVCSHCGGLQQVPSRWKKR